MAEFRMPSLGADMESGKLVQWQVKPGDLVKRGDIIATVETQKGLFEVENFEEGVVEHLLVEPGKTVPVGTVLATLGVKGEAPAAQQVPQPQVVRVEPGPEGPVVIPTAAPTPAAPTPAGPTPAGPTPAGPTPAGPTPAGPTPAGPTPPAGPIPTAATSPTAVPSPAAAAGGVEAAPIRPQQRILASPSARRLAADVGVDLGAVMGSGPHGAIERADVERAAREKTEAVERAAREKAAPAQAPAPPAEEKPPALDYQSAMRQAIAAAMSRSNREIPHYYLGTDIDMSASLRWLEGENLKRPIKDRMLPAVLLLKAVALSLVDVPELNGFWIDDRHQIQESINIGFAITLRQGGLITPAIHGVDLLTLDELTAALRDLISRTRSGHLRSSEMTDATVTVTNLGDLGVTTAYGVIYPPQVALVGFGRISERPWAENGLLGVRRVVTATLSADHRATDGHRGSQFLEALNRHLQEPEKL